MGIGGLALAGPFYACPRVYHEESLTTGDVQESEGWQLALSLRTLSMMDRKMHTRKVVFL